MSDYISEQDKKQLLLFTKYLMTWGLDEGTLEIEGHEGAPSLYWDGFDKIKVLENYDLKVPQNIKEILKDLAYLTFVDSEFKEEDEFDSGYTVLRVVFNVKERKLYIEIDEEYFIDISEEDQLLADEDPKLDAIIEELKELTSENVLELTYEGSGDSGYISDEFEGGTVVPQSVLHYCYVWLERHHGGWEIDDGSDGRFIFNLKNRYLTTSHTFYERKINDAVIFELSLV